MEFKKNKKGISAVISILIIVAITISAVGLLWYVVNNLIEGQTQGAECINTIGNVLINNYYTCNGSEGLKISVELKDVSDVNVSKVIVEVYGESGSKSFNIPGSDSSVKNSTEGVNFGDPIFLPSKNSAKIYYMDLGVAGIGDASMIEITPVVGTHQCDGVSDRLTNIESCDSIFT